MPRPFRPATILGITAILLVSEGFPYGAVTELMPLYLRASGVSLTRIGLLSVIGFAWTLKLFWAPLVDSTGTYRRWILGALTVMLCTWAGLAAGIPPGGTLFWCAVAALALASATQDIAVDALTIAMTPQSLLGAVNSTRVTAYRIAMILAGGGLAAVASFSGWNVAFAIGAALCGTILLATFMIPEIPREPSPPSTLFADIRAWLARSHAGPAIAVVLLYRLADFAITPMLKPFWVDHGYSAAEIGTVTTAAGFSLTIAGAIAGGVVVARYGLVKALLSLGLLALLSNAGYALIASTTAARPAMYTAAFVESFTNGLGTAAFLSFLMALCDRRNAATEYALISALFGLSRQAIGSVSGYTAERLGYPTYFWITVALGIPGLLLVLKARPMLDALENVEPVAPSEV